MEYRLLGGSGFKVPALSLGTGTFGGGNEFFKSWGTSDVKEASRLVDICLEAGLTMFDSADVYSGGMAEEILGQAAGIDVGAVEHGDAVIEADIDQPRRPGRVGRAPRLEKVVAAAEGAGAEAERRHAQP